ncbi:hypothetical protein AXF42_Ash019947 [Apostasia shenzhenica]|uniref:Uncharacterized protein n=1 Tax=Apostasia shenzhenica TaxID=1088818 RepID=A0A2I0AZJ5_9ASPA|nr:hypothetical protein AXF42_Ash019947 [Apostasia shenzhenica]
MAGLLETWGGELVKLGRRKTISQAKSAAEEGAAKDGFDEKEAAAAAAAGRMGRRRSGPSISEATLCMLMDRFAPS